jgi:hypothetical protein
VFFPSHKGLKPKRKRRISGFRLVGDDEMNVTKIGRHLLWLVGVVGSENGLHVASMIELQGRTLYCFSGSKFVLLLLPTLLLCSLLGRPLFRSLLLLSRLAPSPVDILSLPGHRI